MPRGPLPWNLYTKMLTACLTPQALTTSLDHRIIHDMITLEVKLWNSSLWSFLNPLQHFFSNFLCLCSSSRATDQVWHRWQRSISWNKFRRWVFTRQNTCTFYVHFHVIKRMTFCSHKYKIWKTAHYSFATMHEVLSNSLHAELIIIYLTRKILFIKVSQICNVTEYWQHCS
jgi:hypothetical protein